VGGVDDDPAVVVATNLARLDEMTEDLADEERIALGLRVKGGDEQAAVGVELVTGGLLDEGFDLVLGESLEG